MPTNSHVPIYGITGFGTYTGAKGGAYTKTPLGHVTDEGATITNASTTVKQRSGTTGAPLHSHVSEYDPQLRVGLASGALDALRIAMGMPTSALTGDLSAGTPTKEVLSVRANNVATEELSLYLETVGAAGPRTWFFPRAKVATLPDFNLARGTYLGSTSTFDLYEGASGDLFWVEDATA